MSRFSSILGSLQTKDLNSTSDSASGESYLKMIRQDVDDMLSEESGDSKDEIPSEESVSADVVQETQEAEDFVKDVFGEPVSESNDEILDLDEDFVEEDIDYLDDEDADESSLEVPDFLQKKWQSESEVTDDSTDKQIELEQPEEQETDIISDVDEDFSDIQEGEQLSFDDVIPGILCSKSESLTEEDVLSVSEVNEDDSEDRDSQLCEILLLPDSTFEDRNNVVAKVEEVLQKEISRYHYWNVLNALHTLYDDDYGDGWRRKESFLEVASYGRNGILFPTKEQADVLRSIGMIK